jgi:D-sedoheptulose 7-phosphate isomerase
LAPAVRLTGPLKSTPTSTTNDPLRVVVKLAVECAPAKRQIQVKIGRVSNQHADLGTTLMTLVLSMIPPAPTRCERTTIRQSPFTERGEPGQSNRVTKVSYSSSPLAFKASKIEVSEVPVYKRVRDVFYISERFLFLMKFKATIDAATETIRLMKHLCESETDLAEIERIVDLMINSFNGGGKVLICGNGGSGCDAQHFAEELTGRFRNDRRALPAVALMDPAHITCVANDFGYDAIFSRSVEALGKKGDIFVGLSTSGNSENVREAIVKANQIEMVTVALLGRDGGFTKGLSQSEIIIPGRFSDRIQEVHMFILHLVTELIERRMFPQNY